MSQGVVWDSSVLIPLILPRSKSTALYQRLDDAGWFIAATPAILGEIKEKLETKASLRKWLNLDDEAIGLFVDDVLPALVRIYPGLVTAIGAIPDDPDDDAVVAAAIESQSNYIVSEDRHLLNLRKYQQIEIFGRDDFQIELSRLGVS